MKKSLYITAAAAVIFTGGAFIIPFTPLLALAVIAVLLFQVFWIMCGNQALIVKMQKQLGVKYGYVELRTADGGREYLQVIYASCGDEVVVTGFDLVNLVEAHNISRPVLGYYELYSIRETSLDEHLGFCDRAFETARRLKAAINSQHTKTLIAIRCYIDMKLICDVIYGEEIAPDVLRIKRADLELLLSNLNRCAAQLGNIQIERSATYNTWEASK